MATQQTTYKRMWRSRHPERARAQAITTQAIHRGEIVVPDRCSDCGRSGIPIQSHHEDYSKPLEITWLCRACHIERHPYSKTVYNSGTRANYTRFNRIDIVDEKRLQKCLEKTFNLLEISNMATIAKCVGVSQPTLRSFLIPHGAKGVKCSTFEMIEYGIEKIYEKINTLGLTSR